MSSNWFKRKVTYKLFISKSNIYKQDLALNNSQGLIYHKTPTKQPLMILYYDHLLW